MRVKLKEKSREKLFLILMLKKSRVELAHILSISMRTFREWEKGNNTIPERTFYKLIHITGENKNDFKFEILSENWNAVEAARKGGLTTMLKHGNPGTKEGRQKGGFASLLIHNAVNTGFLTGKDIFEPKQSEELAEMLGILVGDGHLTDYQTSMTTSSITDLEHAFVVSRMFKRLFRVEAPIQKNSGSNSVDVVVSSKKLVDYLVSAGMIKGNKIHNGLQIPEWIIHNRKYWKPFIRGLFDTDGCVYLDRHYRGNKTYKHIGWTISSNADKLVKDIISVLEGMGFSPTYRKSQHSVYLRKQDEINRYFTEVGTHNPKHESRYQKFNGEVA